MKKQIIFILPFVLLLLTCCNNKKVTFDFHQPNWDARKVGKNKIDSLSKKKTYLPVYAQIYEISEEKKIDLAVTVSIRNTNIKDSIYLSKIDYYNTKGHLIRQYITNPVYVGPAETVEIVIKSMDNEGGTGANFLFEWHAAPKTSAPLFESVMISTTSQQGISFTSRGVNID